MSPSWVRNVSRSCFPLDVIASVLSSASLCVKKYSPIKADNDTTFIGSLSSSCKEIVASEIRARQHQLAVAIPEIKELLAKCEIRDIDLRVQLL